MSTPRHYNTLQDVVRNVPIVYRLYAEADRDHNRAPLESAVIALANVNEALLLRVMDLELIAPRKITMAGGTYIYRCPDELVPNQIQI